MCGLHNWDYRYDTGVSEYRHDEVLKQFTARVEDDAVWVDAAEIATWTAKKPGPMWLDQWIQRSPHEERVVTLG